MELVERKVKPIRLVNNRESYRRYWWQYAEKRGEMIAAISKNERVLVVARIASALAFAYLPASIVYSEKNIVFAEPAESFYAALQSRVHEIYARFFCSSLKDDLLYTPSTCFDPFPFPTALLGANTSDSTQEVHLHNLGSIGQRYLKFRAGLMIANNEGLTSTYNRFHDPAETSPDLLELRRLHDEMDQAVLQSYGWSDVPTACGFGLDYLDTEEDALLPDDLQERIDSGELFFWEAGDALDFQGQLQAYGAISGRRKLPWRYRWPDAVRDDVLARLLALNAERYEEEVRLGLHSRATKQAAKAAGAGGASGKRRGRPRKAAKAGDTEVQQAEQMGLGL
jgi:hypothetical protein